MPLRPATRPCPFCGSPKVVIEQPCTAYPTAVLTCPQCLAIGPMTHLQSVDDAVFRWNSRTGDPVHNPAIGAAECSFFLDL